MVTQSLSRKQPMVSTRAIRVALPTLPTKDAFTVSSVDVAATTEPPSDTQETLLDTAPVRTPATFAILGRMKIACELDGNLVLNFRKTPRFPPAVYGRGERATVRALLEKAHIHLTPRPYSFLEKMDVVDIRELFWLCACHAALVPSGNFPDVSTAGVRQRSAEHLPAV